MSSPLTLMELSDDDKLKILEQCDLESIFALRRTCHDFRDLIDDKKPDGKIEDINVSSYHDNRIFLDVRSQERHYKTKYRLVDKGCKVIKRRNYELNKEFLVTGQNHLDIFFQDFKNFMSYQKTVLQRMSLSLKASSGIIDLLHDYLKTRKTAMKVKHLQLNLPEQSQYVRVLPFFDAQYIQSINIIFNDSNELSQELVSLDQWKSAKNALISEFNLGMLDHCMHFKEMTVYVDDSVRDAEDIPAFKRKMHESRHLQSMTMYFDPDYPISEQLGTWITLQNDGKEFSR